MTRHLSRHTRPRATRVLVIYSRATGARRRVIDADDDAEYRAHINQMHPGEGFFFLVHDDYDAHRHPEHLDETTARKAGFGKAPAYEDGLHDVVHPRGHVVATTHADPTCGDHGEHFGKSHRLVKRK